MKDESSKALPDDFKDRDPDIEHKLREINQRSENLLKQVSPSGHSMEQEYLWIIQNTKAVSNFVKRYLRIYWPAIHTLWKIRKIAKEAKNPDETTEAILSLTESFCEMTEYPLDRFVGEPGVDRR